VSARKKARHGGAARKTVIPHRPTVGRKEEAPAEIKRATRIQYVKLEADSARSVVRELKAGIGDVLDALSAIGPESRGSLDLTHALTKLHGATSWLDSEIGGES
jgi:hypothetical protein